MALQNLTTKRITSTSTTTATTIQCCHPKQDLKGQSVAVIGLGKSGVAAARLALARGASVLAIDQNEYLDPLEQNILFERNSSLRTVLGNFNNELFKDADMVVVSPGVPLAKYGLSSLLHSGKRVLSELDFAAEVLPKSTKILAVTGTNGKSTVATFAGQMLSHLNIETFVGGNLGIPLSEAALNCLISSPGRPAFQVAVVEVSSYQLEIPNKHFFPSVAVVLNLTPDHLERHKTLRNYAVTKCRLFSHMRDNKMGILPFGNQHLNEAVADHVHEINLAWIGAFPGLKVDNRTKFANIEIPMIGCVSQLNLGAIKTIGAHNYHNAAVAALSLIGLDVGISTEAISSTIGELQAPPHRMQIVHKDTRGVTWVDDSKATNVEATYVGLIGLKEQKSVVLLGGLAKVLDTEGSNGFERLVEPLRFHRGVITFGSSGMMIQKTLLVNGLGIPCIRVRNLKDAVKLARSMARDGIPGDRRCLFRAVAYGYCLRSGESVPIGKHQIKLADKLRGRVADEFDKRQKETKWFIEGDFSKHVSRIRKPYIWGGEPELLMAPHVLSAPITVFMYNQKIGGVTTIAEYGQEYGKEDPVTVL